MTSRFNRGACAGVSLSLGIAFWSAVKYVAGVTEPWDAPDFWTLWYPITFAVGVSAGLLLTRRGGLATFAFMLAQLPVMWISSGVGPMSVFGALLAVVLALPPTAMSVVSNRMAGVRRPDDAA